MFTWGQIKLLTLQKIDPANKTLNPTRNTKDYLNAMVGVANRGLQDLSTAGKYITKTYSIVQSDVTNLLSIGEMFEVVQHNETDISYETNGAKAYYFEVAGTATVQIAVNGAVVQTIENQDRMFHAYKGFIQNPDGEAVKITFTGQYLYQFRNVALYSAVFEREEDIWDFVPEKRYDFRKLIPDFFRLLDDNVILQSGSSKMPYIQTDDYYWEGDSVLVLKGLQRGEWIIHYYSYPQEITDDTPNDTVIELDEEVANLLPIYMASELYEDDDTSTAFYYRQQYDTAKQRLQPSTGFGKSEFIDVQGW